MKRTTALLSFCSSVLVAMLLVYGCGDDDNAVVPKKDSGIPETAPTPDTGGGDAKIAPPAPPKLGAQIDRVGRPAINTAANNTFTPPATRDPAEDAYNADGTPTGWVAKFTPEISKNLGIYDGLDTNCGTQLLADNDAGAGRYKTLGSLLADDRQWLNTASTACKTYLAVELNATGKVPNTDCGGRKLDYDVIDATYSAISGTEGMTDGIVAVPGKTSGTAFPYLAPPQQ